MARSPRLKKLFGESRRSLKAGKGLSPKDFWKAVADRARKKSKAP